MNKKQKNKKFSRYNKKQIFWLILILCASIVAILTFLVVKNNNNKSKKEDKKESISVQKKEEKNNLTNIDNEKIDKPENETHKPVQFENIKPETNEIIGFINYKDFIDENLVINVVIRQLLTQPGKCTLSLSSGDTNIDSITVDTGNDPSTSYCKSFKIPRNKLNQGSWKIKVDIKAGEKTGTITDRIEL